MPGASYCIITGEAAEPAECALSSLRFTNSGVGKKPEHLSSRISTSADALLMVGSLGSRSEVK